MRACAVWGVSNSSTFYTPATGPGTNHLWSVGATPFSPLANVNHLPATLAALMPRNLALSILDQHTAHLRAVLLGFRMLSK